MGLSLDLLFLSLFSIFVSAILSNRNSYKSEFLLWDGNSIPSLDAIFLLRWALQVPSHHCRAFHLRSLPLSPETLLTINIFLLKVKVSLKHVHCFLSWKMCWWEMIYFVLECTDPLPLTMRLLLTVAGIKFRIKARVGTTSVLIS